MSRTLFGARKSGSPPLQLRGGNRHGVVVTDPAGAPVAVPFTGSTSDVLRGDGTFGPVAGGGGGSSPDVTDGYWEPVMVGDPYAAGGMQVLTNYIGEPVMVFREWPT